MRIVKLTAENVKRLRAVEITPEGDTVVIAGRNAQGKSSVLDAIWMALAGGSGSKETSRPIRDGESTASVELDLGDLIVTREWTAAGTALKVASRDGARYPSPQTILDGLIGRLSFDPLDFAQQAPKEQLATLLSVVELPFVPEEVDAKRRGVFEERTEVNRDVKRLEAQLAGIEAVPEGTPDGETSAVLIAAELSSAEDSIRIRDSLSRRRVEASAEIERLEKLLAEAVELSKDLNDQANALPEAPNVEAIRERLASVDEVNENVRRKQERARLTAELESSRKLSTSLTGKLEQIDQSKADAIAAAEMPLEGLSFDEEGVLYQGVPFSQASAAERLRVGIAIAMALNPRIRVIRITDGSLLDSENLALIDEMAQEHDFQIWLERVDETGSVGITIEDGQVVESKTAIEREAA